MVRIVDMRAITNVESKVCEHCQAVLSPMQQGYVLDIEGKEHVFCGKRCAEHFLHPRAKKSESKLIIV
ncbi:MAG: hypothetical protein QXL78_01955 [Methanocellales archaeon]